MKIPTRSNLRQFTAAFAACAVVSLTQCNADRSGSAADAEESVSPEQPEASEAASGADRKETGADDGKPMEVTAADFGEFIEQADGVVLVDFWAEWCQPCHIIAPEVEKVAKTYSGRVQVVKVDLTEDPGDDFSDKYGIDFLPTVIIFKDGKSEGNLIVNGRPMPDAAGMGAALDKQL